MKQILIIRKIVISLVTLIILIWAFVKNTLWAKIIILPFIVCAFSILLECLFSILQKPKISNIFKYIFRISFFTYIFILLGYIIYYSIVNKSYSFLILIAIFIPFIIYFFKKSFIKNRKKLIK